MAEFTTAFQSACNNWAPTEAARASGKFLKAYVQPGNFTGANATTEALISCSHFCSSMNSGQCGNIRRLVLRKVHKKNQRATRPSPKIGIIDDRRARHVETVRPLRFLDGADSLTVTRKTKTFITRPILKESAVQVASLTSGGRDCRDEFAGFFERRNVVPPCQLHMISWNRDRKGFLTTKSVLGQFFIDIVLVTAIWSATCTASFPIASNGASTFLEIIRVCNSSIMTYSFNSR
ncbi:hypothetical protein C8R45DRAFT_934485 [Mycena sanguinolenta]|nr:hypothetical protein C8R45DRAFT_934485 [Mycena sanguinolenta]